MSTLTVEIPDEIQHDIEAFVENNPEYEDAGSVKTEKFVRDAILLYLYYSEVVDEKATPRRLSAEFEEEVERGNAEIDQGQYVSLDEV
jgi:Arc/MetJ-type ribon-helix-helix transcriptional regulator